MINFIKRGHTVKLKEPFIEQINEREMLVIEQDTKAFVREVYDNKVLLNIPSIKKAIILMDSELSKYIKFT